MLGKLSFDPVMESYDNQPGVENEVGEDDRKQTEPGSVENVENSTLKFQNLHYNSRYGYSSCDEQPVVSYFFDFSKTPGSFFFSFEKVTRKIFCVYLTSQISIPSF